MEIIQVKNIEFVDNKDVRYISSSMFNWCLDKGLSIAATWGKTEKETPLYDPIGPQELVWKITDKFDLYKFIEYFNFLANVRQRKDDQVLPVTDITDCLSNYNNYVAMSTLSNIIFILDEIPNKFLEFVNYIRSFNVSIKTQINCNTSIYQDDLLKISPFVILNVNPDFKTHELIKYLDTFKDNFNINIKLHVNADSNIQLSKFIQEISDDVYCTIYCDFPYLSTRKFLNFQSACLTNNKTNIALAQCSKKYYSKDVIGSLIIENTCSFCRYSLYLENDNVYVCESMKVLVGHISDFKYLSDLWNNLNVINVRKQIIDNNKCDRV